MKIKSTQLALEWIIIGLMIGSIMLFGWQRMHQLNINRFLILSFCIIIFLTAAYRSVVIRFFPVTGENVSGETGDKPQE